MRFNKMSSCIEPRRAPGSRRSARGAIFVEAVAVISALTLGLIALAYVHELYVKKLGVSRLTRAALIAHSMVGCKGNSPRDWIAKDLGKYTAKGANQDQQSASGKDNGGAPAGGDSAKANGLIQRTGVTSSDGKGMLNPITDTEFDGQASVSAKGSDGRGPSRSVFSGQVRSKSYVSCGDQVKDGDFDRIFGAMKDEISNLLGK